MSACPACHHENGEEARFCVACGSPLVQRCPSCGTINARTRERCHHCATLLHAAAPVLEAAVDTVRDTTPEPALDDSELTLSLRDADLPSAQPMARSRPRAREVPLPPIVTDEVDLPTIEMPEPAQPPAEAPLPAAKAPLPAAEPPPPARPKPSPRMIGGFAERKAEMRAAVRRARQRHQQRGMAQLGERPEVLLLEPDPATRERLSGVLDQFGFSAHAVGSVRDADTLVGSVRFVASFIGLGVQDAQAIGLCTRLRAMPQATERPLAVVAMVEKGQHAERVRMELAGADAVLFRPVDRGQVARALEDSGVRLPQDPRAAARRGGR